MICQDLEGMTDLELEDIAKENGNCQQSAALELLEQRARQAQDLATGEELRKRLKDPTIPEEEKREISRQLSDRSKGLPRTTAAMQKVRSTEEE